MRITLIGAVPPYKGGISEFNNALIQELKKKHQLQILSWKKMYPAFAVKEHIDKNTPPLEGASFDLHYAKPTTWINATNTIKKFNPNLIIIPWVTPLATPVHATLLKLIKRKTKATILTLCHNILPHEKSKLDQTLATLFFKTVDSAIVHSEQDKILLKRINKNLHIIKAFHPLYDSYPPTKIPVNLPHLNKKIILFFGFIRPYKGLTYLLDAMPPILKKIKLDLLIVGEFWEDKYTYLTRIKNLNIQNNIKLVSHYIPKEEVGAYFQKADAVILPYTSGTQSGIIQLAYNYNKPVICTDVGGFKEAVPDGKTGYVVPPRDPEKLAQAIINFYKYQHKKPMQKNIRQWKKNFSWENYCKLLLS